MCAGLYNSVMIENILLSLMEESRDNCALRAKVFCFFFSPLISSICKLLLSNLLVSEFIWISMYLRVCRSFRSDYSISWHFQPHLWVLMVLWSAQDGFFWYCIGIIYSSLFFFCLSNETITEWAIKTFR